MGGVFELGCGVREHLVTSPPPDASHASRAKIKNVGEALLGRDAGPGQEDDVASGADQVRRGLVAQVERTPRRGDDG